MVNTPTSPLRECPFCASTNLMLMSTENHDRAWQECLSCRARGPLVMRPDGIDHARELTSQRWNDRRNIAPVTIARGRTLPS